MATTINPLYLYTWRLPYKNREFDDPKQNIVIYNYAHDKDSARHYVILELQKIGNQADTIAKLSRGEIYPVHSFLTDEVDKKTTVRVYIHDTLAASERPIDPVTNKRSNHKDVLRRQADTKLAIDKKDRVPRKPSRTTGLLFREYIFQDTKDLHTHYIAKTIVEADKVDLVAGEIMSYKNDYIEEARKHIATKWHAGKPISMEVKNHPGDLHTGVRMGFDNKPGVLEIVKVENWGYKESNLQLVSVPQSVATYKELKEKRVAARKKTLRDKRNQKRLDEIYRIGEDKYIEERREKRNRNREARKLADEASGKTPAAAPTKTLYNNQLDFGLDSVPSKYRV